DAVFLNFTHRGNLGVDFFFVLSGFIIVFAHYKDINQPKRAPEYLLKRLHDFSQSIGFIQRSSVV
ncbi:hypothetical protein NSP34_25335, partial [Salmonella enterica]|nr:hypothetical protein [Salmonella enterica]